VHEHVARAIYYLSVQLMVASAVGVAAWGITSIRVTSPTAKYWIWVAAAFNFVVPLGALIDAAWGRQLAWAQPFGVIGEPVWNLTQGPAAIVIAAIWVAGACAMLVRLGWRLHRDRGAGASMAMPGTEAVPAFAAHGIPVCFGDTHAAPAVGGLVSPRILLPAGIDRLLEPRELHAVLMHEVAHARRRDNLVRLLYELSLCALWFHPLVWIAGARMAIYRELSCDECVIRGGHGKALISALAKLAAPERSLCLQAMAASCLGHRLARLAGPPQASRRAGDTLVASLFAAVAAAGVFEVVAHTACCFLHAA
jgi:beta-lactamase regulating signal transducer with metallopeptidase domain